jgi:hypothetical protein
VTTSEENATPSVDDVTSKFDDITILIHGVSSDVSSDKGIDCTDPLSNETEDCADGGTSDVTVNVTDEPLGKGRGDKVVNLVDIDVCKEGLCASSKKLVITKESRKSELLMVS